jgi:restriction endonuclease Mrr
VLGEDEKARAQLAATATQLFASEDDDDDPIFAADEEENGEADTLDSSGAGKRRRRRRRRRGGERDDDDLPTYTVMDAPFEATEESQSEPAEARPPREPNRDNREARRPAPERSDEERETRRQREPREDDRDRDKPTNDKPINAEELSGAGLADSIESLLAPFQRQGWASSRQVADALLRRAKNAFSDAQQAHTAVISAIRIDNMRRGATGQRPRFRTSNGRLGLTEWLLDSESLRLERDLFALIQRYRETVRRGFLRKLNELPQRGFTELVQLLLERMGYSDFKSVRRPGAHQSEQHFSALAGGSFGEMRVAVIVRRDGRDIGRERVTDLRGALHHYGPASGGVLVTTGQALSGAREEAAASAAAPMVLVDGAALARLADEQAVGLNHSEIRLPLLDVELIDSLKNNG